MTRPQEGVNCAPSYSKFRHWSEISLQKFEIHSGQAQPDAAPPRGLSPIELNMGLHLHASLTSQSRKYK